MAKIENTHSSHMIHTSHRKGAEQISGKNRKKQKVTTTDPDTQLHKTRSDSTLSPKSLNQRKVATTKSQPTKSPQQSNATFGVNNVANHSKQGLPKDLIEKMVDLATARNSVIASRSVEPIAKQLLAEGYPTKNFNVKGKSSNWGLQAGTITTDQALSKKAGSSDINKLNKEVEKSLTPKTQNAFLSNIKPESTLHKAILSKGKPDAMATHLTISDERLKELNDQGLFETIEKTKGKEEWVVTTRERNDPNAPLHTQIAKRAEDGKLSVYHLDKHGKEQPVYVLAHVPETPDEKPMPLTADLDLLFEAAPVNEVDFGHEDRMPNPRVSPESVMKTAEHYKNKALKKQLSDGFLNNEKPGLGNVSKRMESLINQSKDVIGRHHPIIHHGADAANPYSKEADNYPVTLFFPKGLQLGFDAAMVFDESQLRQIIELLQSKDFHVPQNPLWKVQHKRPSFSDAQDFWKGKDS